METLISQGAEGKIYITAFMSEKVICKERFIKKYRVKELDDKLTKSRMLNESRNIARASKSGINTPTLLFVDLKDRKIYMSYINNSCQLKLVLKKIYDDSDYENKYGELIKKIIDDLGNMLIKLHKNDLVHGDLTPSNILLTSSSKSQHNTPIPSDPDLVLQEITTNKKYDFLYLIDFGLSYMSKSTNVAFEDKAVDLYVLKRAMISFSPKSEELFEKTMEFYEKNYDCGKEILNCYRKVEMRGRKKLAFG